jgi:D-alanyl-lipoteichoic acid acyltransferase DltB (MBOAT superfamily)
MLFNSISYLTFLLIVVFAFWMLPPRWRQKLMLISSIAFYALWRIEFVFLVAFSAFVDYFLSLKINATKQPARRLAYMLLSISTNLGLLAYFKYTYFILGNVALLTGFRGELFSAVGNIVLPLGISFYTFLSISYTLDVYRREFTPVRSFSLYLTYVTFWPHMIAGPILRAHELIPQLTKSSRLSAEDIGSGLRAILFGLFLKVALADQLAPLVDDAFVMEPARLGGLDVLTMAFAFGLQIYFDFAGYSMIAIGSARLIGVIFPENFNWPYLATSPREFWRRWHITLSSWIRDYLYLPLSGLRDRSHSTGGIDVQFIKSHNAVRATVALFLTWFLMGLWHGASWNFAFWGLWHAGFIFVYRWSNRWFAFDASPLLSVLGWGTTLLIVMLGWIFFRAPTLPAAFTLYGRIFDVRSYLFLSFRENFYLIVAVAMISMLLLRWLTVTRLFGSLGSPVRAMGEVAGVAAAMFIVFIFLRPLGQFIYFQF